MKTDHFMRAWYAVPPAAQLRGFEVRGDILRVTYQYAGCRLPNIISVSL